MKQGGNFGLDNLPVSDAGWIGPDDTDDDSGWDNFGDGDGGPTD